MTDVQQAHRLARDLGREVRVAHRHLDRRVPEQLLDHLERRAAHGDVTGERVPKAMPADLTEPGATTDAIERVLGLIYSRGRFGCVAVTPRTDACDVASIGFEMLRSAA